MKGKTHGHQVQLHAGQESSSEPKSILPMLLEQQQAWSHDHIPRDSIPVLDHSLSEELYPNVQFELLLTQL